MKYCANCGNPMEDNDIFCTNCGEQFPDAIVENTVSHEQHTSDSEPEVRKINYEEEWNSVKENISNTAGKAISGAQDIAAQISQKVEDRKQSIQAQVAEEVRQQEEKKKSRKSATLYGNVGNNYMSSTELWSWLKKDSKRQRFFTEDFSELTEEEFMHKIADKIKENGVPAHVEKRPIQWDRSSLREETYFVEPETTAVNPLSCLIQFNHIGKFTFVEEKTFITPPDLPEVPMSPLPVDPALLKKAGYLIMGIILLIIGVCFFMLNAAVGMFGSLAVVALLAGALLTFIGFNSSTKLKAIREHNQKCQEQEKAWNAAWTNWQNSIFLHSFQEDINGHLSRIFDSVFDCIKQVSDEEFKGRVSKEQEDSNNMNELEQLIARRKEDYR